MTSNEIRQNAHTIQSKLIFKYERIKLLQKGSKNKYFELFISISFIFILKNMTQTEVRVGVACFVFYNDSEGSSYVLLGQRKGSHGSGTWQLPGGHLEMFESFEICAKREVFEESNIDLRNEIRFLTATNNIMGEKHYVTIFMCSEISSKEAENVRVMEPHKLEGEWKWVTLEELKQNYKPKFSPLQSFIDNHDLSFLK